MAVLDIIGVTMSNPLKRHVLDTVVNYTGTGAISTTKMIMAVRNTNLSNVAQADINVDVYFRYYDSAQGGVRVTSYEVPVPAGRKITGFRFYEEGQTGENYSVVVNLEPVEVKEFSSNGVLYVEVISIDLTTSLQS